MEIKKLTCIVCPMGCSLVVQLLGKTVASVSGNTCPRGEAYARAECESPTRTLTTTIKVDSREMLSVKSERPLPKENIKDYMKIINYIELQAPIHIGDVLISNIGNTGVSIVATKNIF